MNAAMRTICVTGSAGGIGRATRARLEGDGHRVIGVDVRDAEVIADLSSPPGRSAMVDAVTRACDGSLDGLVAGAGIMGSEPLVVSINFFGAITTLEGLRALLARGRHAAAVAISSNSTTTTPALPEQLVGTMLAGDEPAACAQAAELVGRLGHALYPASKLALARWVRHQAPRAEWIGAGINLNAIAPGVTATPMTENDMEFIFSIPDVFPVPIGRPGRPDEIASLLAYLVSGNATFMCGSVLFVDGGTDAAVRADDFPSARPDGA
jgi:NAD(P)-dependent dehydrogenase (short-subunit alcohol dehydrogenase family)